jgi:hypothetical protein
VYHIEGALGLPPGSMTVAANMDRADLAQVTLSDPRVMRKSIPWPGASNPGGSVADPIRPGVWQDLDDVEYVVAGHHLQIMVHRIGQVDRRCVEPARRARHPP